MSDAVQERPSRAAVAPAEPVCARCATPHVDGQRFCRGCGAPLTDGAPVDRLAPATPHPFDDQLTQAAMSTTAADDGEATEQRPTSRAKPILPPTEPLPSRASVPADPPTAVDASAPTLSRACEICGAPAAGRFCEDCDAATEITEGDAPSPRQPPPHAQPLPVAPSKTRRRRGAWAALVALVLLAIGGAGAFLLLRDDDRETGTPAAAAERARATTTSRPARDDRSNEAPGQAAATATGSTSIPEDPRPEPSTRNSTAADNTTTPERTPTTPEKSEPAEPGPVSAMREHWLAIGSRDLEAAYSRFSSQYTRRTTYREWAGAQRDFDPDISIASVRLADQLSPGKAVVRLTVVTRDRGSKGDAARCNVFQGRVLLRRQSGRWRYDPSGLSKGSFGPKKRGGFRPSSDKRCDRLF